MANVKYTVQELTLQNTGSAPFVDGITRDTYIDEKDNGENYGGEALVQVSIQSVTAAPGGRYERFGILEITMPSDADYEGLDELIKVELEIKLTASFTTCSYMGLAIIELGNDIWDEGVLSGAAGFCNWDFAQQFVAWSKGSGAIKSRVDSHDDADGPIIDTKMVAGTLGWTKFDITPIFEFGDVKTIVIYVTESDCSAGIGDTDIAKSTFYSNEHLTTADRSKIIITHKDFAPEAFADKDSALSIEPNPNNPEQPLLKWGGVKDADFVDFKLYRDTVPITTIAGLSGDGKLLDTITSPADQEYIDDDAVDPLVDGDTYYYVVIAEDGNNTLDNATFSNNILFTKPDVTTAVLSDTGSQDVGINETITVVSPQNIKRLFVDWDDDKGGDGDVESWHEYETVGLTKTANHIYSRFTGNGITSFADAGGGFVWAITANSLTNGDTVTISGTTNYNGTYVISNAGPTGFTFLDTWVATETGLWSAHIKPDVRVEDEDGFWSSLTALTGSAVYLSDTAPTAKLRVSVKKETLGDDITLDGSLSQPVASNVTITKYEFKRDAADSWQDNGADPVYTFDSGTYPNTVGVKTASLQITTSSALTDTDTATYELETGTPTTLSFSKDTKIHELNHSLGQNKTVDIPIGSDGVEHEFLLSRRAERVTLSGTSNHPNTGVDIDIIRSAWLNNTYCRISVTTEMEDHNLYYDCKIDGDVSTGHSYDNKQSWSFPIRVIKRWIDITLFANGGGGKVTATSTNHGLSDGDEVTITGTTNYDGTYTISSVTDDTFEFTDTWVATDTGYWVK